jgi:hypothetical protein
MEYKWNTGRQQPTEPANHPESGTRWKAGRGLMPPMLPGKRGAIV